MKIELKEITVRELAEGYKDNAEAGNIKLNWNRNGNAPLTQFAIKYSLSPSTACNLLNVVTKTSYIHKGHPIGAPIQYHVKARRNGETSVSNNIALVNPG